ncbi:MAG: hypothetical protein HC883_03675 [Bdellovibrionaceae bacterium]|nr:hypothetical protein [Pseudobdellovibrionaceae bacterium]
MAEKLGDGPRVATFLASCQARDARWDNARRSIERAVNQSPRDPLIQAWYSYVFKESGDPEQASVILGRATEYNRRGEFVLPALLQARFCQSNGDVDCARDSWQQIYERDLDYLPAVAGLVADLDLAAEGRFTNGLPEPLGQDDIETLEAMKTGALLRFSCVSGAILGQADREARLALDRFGAAIGKAFQIADDLLDAEGDPTVMGKAAGKDQKAGKATFVTILGAERARAQAKLLANQAAAHLELFDEKADLLRGLAAMSLTGVPNCRNNFGARVHYLIQLADGSQKT